MVSRFKPSVSPNENAPEHRFIESVRVRRVPREIQIHWRPFVLIVFWILITVKCLLAHWAILYWKMPIASIYVWGPTVLAAFLCSVVFLASSKMGGSE